MHVKIQVVAKLLTFLNALNSWCQGQDLRSIVEGLQYWLRDYGSIAKVKDLSKAVGLVVPLQLHKLDHENRYIELDGPAGLL